ncbi:MAG: hypothetical protein ACLR0U_00340 [Enterocloster clostridioformis]
MAFYRSLLKEAGLEEEVEEELNQYIENKNYFAVEGLLKNQSMDEGLKMAFLEASGAVRFPGADAGSEKAYRQSGGPGCH